MKEYDTMKKLKGLDIDYILELEQMIIYNNFTKLQDEIRACALGRIGFVIDESRYTNHYYDFGNGRTTKR